MSASAEQNRLRQLWGEGWGEVTYYSEPACCHARLSLELPVFCDTFLVEFLCVILPKLLLPLPPARITVERKMPLDQHSGAAAGRARPSEADAAPRRRRAASGDLRRRVEMLCTTVPHPSTSPANRKPIVIPLLDDAVIAPALHRLIASPKTTSS